MKLTRTHLTNVTHRQEVLPMNAFFELIERSEKLLFEKGIYKNGPTVIETPLSTFGQAGETTFSVYIPTNIPVDWESGFKFLEDYDIEGLSEVTRFDENLMPTLEKMQEELDREKLNLDGDRLYIVILPVFGETFVELILPVKEV